MGVSIQGIKYQVLKYFKLLKLCRDCLYMVNGYEIWDGDVFMEFNSFQIRIYLVFVFVGFC